MRRDRGRPLVGSRAAGFSAQTSLAASTLTVCRQTAEMHIYERGPHGAGLAPKDPILSSWPGRLEGWLKTRGLTR